MKMVKDLGYLMDEGEYIALPLIAEYTGKYTIKVKTPERQKPVERIWHAVQGEALKVPNYNGKKTLSLGSNIIHLLDANRKRTYINGSFVFEVFLEQAETLSGFSGELHKIEQAASIWEIDNPNKRSYSILPYNPMGIRIDYLDSSTEDKIIIDWKHIPRTGAIQLH